MNLEDIENSYAQQLENAVLKTLEDQQQTEKQIQSSTELYIFPLIRRPFFPGMAAPVVIEPGPFFETLKLVAKSEHKSIGLVLTRTEDIDIYKASFDDLFHVGVMARLLRIIPLEQGGAQVILNMEKRLRILRPIADSKVLKAKVAYYEDNPALTPELKAYAISIISTIKELLKLNPLFKEELQIFLGHSDFTEPGKVGRFCCGLNNSIT